MSPESTSSSGFEQIRQAIRAKYAEVSISASGKFSYPTGIEGARLLGYDPTVLHSAPDALLASFCGVGNPFSLGPVTQGQTVLDYGCGAGFDVFVASRLVGQAGRVCGIDLTENMTRKAQENLSRAGIGNFEVKQVNEEKIPYSDNAFDIVISNGVVNLVQDKEAVFREVHRVLKPGGSFRFADVILEKELPSSLSSSVEAWSQ